MVLSKAFAGTNITEETKPVPGKGFDDLLVL